MRLIKRIARREKVRVQVAATVRRKSEVADLVRGLERAAHQISAGPDVLRPRQDDISKVHVGPGLEALQPALFDQVIAEPAESKAGLVVAEARAGEQAQRYIGEARGVTVADLDAEIDGPTDGDGKEVRIRIPRRHRELGQYIQSGKGCRVARQREFDECLDRAVSEGRPDLLVFPTCVLRSRMRRPLDAEMPEVVETGGDRAGALIECHVQVDAQARNRRAFDRRSGVG